MQTSIGKTQQSSKYLKQRNAGQTTREIKAPFTAPTADDKK